jgi:hypothetical protein
VAFDGLDKELIDDFGLENIKQSEFGEVKNHESVSKIVTSELFACFITGEKYDEHGIRGNKAPNSKVTNLIYENLLSPSLSSRIRGMHRLRNIIKKFPILGYKKPDKTQFKTDTLFDKIDESKDLFINGYSFYNKYYSLDPFQLNKRGSLSKSGSLNLYRRKEEEHRRNELLKPTNRY